MKIRYKTCKIGKISDKCGKDFPLLLFDNFKYLKSGMFLKILKFEVVNSYTQPCNAEGIGLCGDMVPQPCDDGVHPRGEARVWRLAGREKSHVKVQMTNGNELVG